MIAQSNKYRGRFYVYLLDIIMLYTYQLFISTDDFNLFIFYLINPNLALVSPS